MLILSIINKCGGGFYLPAKLILEHLDHDFQVGQLSSLQVFLPSKKFEGVFEGETERHDLVQVAVTWWRAAGRRNRLCLFYLLLIFK